MHRLFFLPLFLALFSVEPLSSAFEGGNDFILYPVSNVYSFLPSDYLLGKKFIFSTSGSQLYSMPECNEVQAAIMTAFPFALFGADISFFGSDLYNETEIGLSASKGTKNLLGIRMKMMKLGIKGYESRLFWSDDLFFLLQYDFFYFQSIYKNVFSYGYKYPDEKPVSSFSSLLRIYPAEWTSFNIGIKFSELTGTSFELGNGIRLSNILSVGGGFGLQTKSVSSNLLLSLGKSTLTYSISIHPELGITHSVGLIFSQAKKKGDG